VTTYPEFNDIIFKSAKLHVDPIRNILFYINEKDQLFFCQLGMTPKRLADAAHSTRERKVKQEGDLVREIWEAERAEAEGIRQEQEDEGIRQEQEDERIRQAQEDERIRQEQEDERIRQEQEDERRRQGQVNTGADLLDKGPDNKPMTKSAKRRANKKAKQAYLEF
jgi:hypothetical protein